MYKGQLAGFPQEVVEKMLEYQVEQGNKRDVRVFESRLTSSRLQGGFTWDDTDTTEGYSFWNDVLRDRNFKLFFRRYPKETESNPIPENWYMVITKENLEIAKKWQKEKSPDYFVDILHVGYLLLSYHPDGSYYYTCGITSFKEGDSYFKNKNYEEITTEQFKKYILKEETTMTTTSQKISREAFESIYNVACSEWKKKLESWAIEQGVFKKEYELTYDQVNEMFAAATTKQKPVLEEAGLTQAFELDLTKSIITSPNGREYKNPITKSEGFDTLISVRNVSADKKHASKSYYLSSHFDWTLETCKEGYQVLVPKFKK